MPRRIHKYDLPGYANALPLQERRYRKAYYFLEKLMDTNPGFANRMGQIKADTNKGKINEQTANQLIHQAIMETIQKNA